MIDPNEAPEGYRAEKPAAHEWLTCVCTDCDFRNTPMCLDACCLPELRNDKCPVIFKRIGPVMATVPLNYGSMGEEVA